ncbi:MAG: DUF1801 domain-containing protein [Deltaproteobacteria bacterium]|nr:MAG: DUF1801 domain-containing protein [Deltaproteobacteria bacterium]
MGHKRRDGSAVKTRPTARDPRAAIAQIDDAERRAEAAQLVEWMEAITGEPPVLWGKDIIGFGRYHYRYASGREGDWMRIGFSPRKRALSIYCTTGFDALAAPLARLGPHRRGVGCLYVRRLAEVDPAALRDLLARSWADSLRRYPPA